MHSKHTQKTRRQLRGPATLVLLLAIAGCDSGDVNSVADPAESTPVVPVIDKPASTIGSAVARIRPTSLGNASGSVRFSADGADDQRMRVSVDLQGLEPGFHGFHVHETGDCSADDASSAGAHFNPDDTAHGGSDATERHAGDMGNIEADDDGRAVVEFRFAGLDFSGPASVLQKSVVIHQKADDLTSQPAGSAGDRVGCGVIQADERQAAVD